MEFAEFCHTNREVFDAELVRVLSGQRTYEERRLLHTESPTSSSHLERSLAPPERWRGVVGSIPTTPEPVDIELSTTKSRVHNLLGKLGLRHRGQMACSARSIFLQHLDGFKLEPGYGTLSGRRALPVARIRVVFIGLSPMLRDIVKQAIGSERDMEIAGEFFADSWAERLRALEPEVVIISLARGEGDDVTSRLMEAAPNAKIVALSFDYRSALCCVGRHQRVLFDVSPQEIAEFISGPN